MESNFKKSFDEVDVWDIIIYNLTDKKYLLRAYEALKARQFSQEKTSSERNIIRILLHSLTLIAFGLFKPDLWLFHNMREITKYYQKDTSPLEKSTIRLRGIVHRRKPHEKGL